MKKNVFMNSKTLSLILEGIMIAGMAIAAGLMIALPFILWDIIVFVNREMVYSDPGNYRWILICLYPALLVALVVLNEVRKIFHVVRKDTPFCETVPKGLKRVSICAFVLAVVTLAKSIVIPGLLTILLLFVFLLVGLCFLVLAEVFEKAVDMKNENDLTI